MKFDTDNVFDLLLRGGTVVSASGSMAADVGILDGRVAAILHPRQTAKASAAMDVTGRLLLPGLVDAHVHLREPGMTQKEDFVSGTRAAAAGGVTTLLVMPTDEPWTASHVDLADKIARANGRLYVDVAFQIAAPLDRYCLDEAVAAGAVSFELFTADVPEKFLHDTVARLSEAMRALSPFGLILGVSPGDQSVIEAEMAAELPDRNEVAGFLRSRPPLAEANGIARAILAAASIQARIHIRQINSESGLETLRRLKNLADVSAETTPQCLLFTAADYRRLGARLKASPPLRAETDRRALLAAVREGLVDIVATDHAPHSLAEKQADYASFADIPGGFAGVQTLLPSMLHLVDEGEIGISDVVRLCALNPAVRFGLDDRKGSISVGRDADIIILDPSRPTIIENRDQLSKARETPFAGLHISYAIECVLKGGAPIYAEGLVSEVPTGRVIAPRWASGNPLTDRSGSPV